MSMQPGIELDKLVCEKVLGLSVEQADKEARGGFMPSLRISDAWEVVEHMAKNGKPLVRMYQGTTAPWWAGFRGDIVDVAWPGETAPHAICVAALKAVGVEI